MSEEEMGSTIKSGVKQVLQELYDRHGMTEAAALVEAATPKDSPAHAGFEWDNKKASHEYRLIQARQWIRRVTVVKDGQEQRLIHVPRVAAAAAEDDDDESREGHYQVRSVLVQRPDEYERALVEAESKFEAARRAVNELYEAAERTGRSDKAAAIAQMAKATAMFSEALQAMH
jgi:hypothetical protein